MRRRRPAKLRLKRDLEATAAMCFSDPDSYVHLDGRHIYVGADHALARAKAYQEWVAAGRMCHRCGMYVPQGDEDWEHIIPKSVRRDDHPRNRAFSHGMFSEFDCHRKQHPRLLKWTPRTVAAAGGGA